MSAFYSKLRKKGTNQKEIEDTLTVHCTVRRPLHNFPIGAITACQMQADGRGGAEPNMNIIKKRTVDFC